MSPRGGDGMDGFFFGAALTGADVVDGGSGRDTLAIQGDYSRGLTLGDIRSAEVFLILSGASTQFGGSGSERYSYDITTTDSNIARFENMTVVAIGLQSNENLTFHVGDSDGSVSIYAGRGRDILVGGAGNDGFFFGENGNLTGDDRIDGGGGVDSVALRGNYDVTFKEDSLTSVEVLALLSGFTNEYTGVIVPDGFRYLVTMADGNVAAGALMNVNAVGLGAEERLAFDGFRETDGAFRILSGAGNDSLSGGQGDDIIYGGLGRDWIYGRGGADTFLYRSAAESTPTSMDSIWDFEVGDAVDVGAMDANRLTPEHDGFTLIGTNAFSHVAGELRLLPTINDDWLIEADVDGDGVADFRVELALSSEHLLTLTNGLITTTESRPVTATPVLAEVEPNDSLASAQQIGRGLLAFHANPDLADDSLPSASVHGAIGGNDDVDYYAITLKQGEKLILDIDHSAGGLDTEILVYAPDGSELGSNDDPGGDDSGSDPVGAYPAIPHTTDSFASFRAPVDGTYVVAVQSFDHRTSGSYQLNVSIGPPATSLAQIRAEDVQSLIGSSWGTVRSLGYSFPTGPGDYSDYPADFTEPANNFHALNSQQQTTVRAVLGAIASFTDMSFAEKGADPGAAELRYAMSDEPDTAYAYYPGSSVGGDAWFRYTGSHYSNPVLGNYAYASFLHETGHALGLKHGHELPPLSYGHDSLEYSVMTYRSYVGAALDGYTNEPYGFPQTYMMYDIAALQQLYGADFTLNATDSVYSWNPDTGQMSINGIGQTVPAANRVFMTIWDGGGNDTYDLSNYANGVTIDLRPGEWTRTSPVQLANLGDGHYARGNVANALLYDGDPRSLVENAIGGAGADNLVANQATNHLTGNAGADIFHWYSASDSAPGAGADIVTDFEARDRIDVSGIDAYAPTPENNDAFRWIESNPFSGAAGELRTEVIDGSTHIFGDVDGDKLPDFEIILANQPVVGWSNFIF